MRLIIVFIALCLPFSIEAGSYFTNSKNKEVRELVILNRIVLHHSNLKYTYEKMIRRITTKDASMRLLRIHIKRINYNRRIFWRRFKGKEINAVGLKDIRFRKKIQKLVKKYKFKKKRKSRPRITVYKSRIIVQKPKNMVAAGVKRSQGNLKALQLGDSRYLYTDKTLTPGVEMKINIKGNHSVGASIYEDGTGSAKWIYEW